MIPQSFKDIISSSDNVGFYQSLALILFVLFFVGLVVFVFSRPKKHYSEQEHSPLEEDYDLQDHKNKQQ